MATKTETKAASAKPVPEDSADSPPEDAEAGAGVEDPGEPKQNSRKPTKMNTGSDDPGDDDEPKGDNEFRSSSERSSARTSELRRFLEPKTKEPPARQRASLGAVKIETVHGSRKDYKAWKKLVEAQQELYS